MKPMRWHGYVTVNLFWLGMNFRNNAINIIMPYLVAALVGAEVRNTALGLMRTGGLVVAMLVQPAAGLLSDRNASRYGRRRPFIFIGVLFDLLFLAAVGLAQGYWSLLAAILLLQFSANVSHGSLQGLIPDLVPEEQRGRASGVKGFFELLPLVLVALSVARLVGAGQIGWAVAVTGGVLLAAMLLTLVLVHEQPLAKKPDTPLGPPMLRVLGVLAGIAAGAGAGLAAGAVVGGLAWLTAWPLAGWETARVVGMGIGGLVAMGVAVVAGVWAGAWSALGQEARRRSSYTWWMVNRLMFFAAVTSVQGFAPYFLMRVLGVSLEASASLTGSLMAVVGLCTMAAALLSGWLADRFGHRMLVGVAGLLASAGTCVLLGTLETRSLAMIYVAGGIVGLAAGLFTTSNWALGTDLVPAQEAGRYLGISNLAGAGAGMIGQGIGGPLVDALERLRPGTGYTAVFACYAVLFVLSAVALRGVRQTAA